MEYRTILAKIISLIYKTRIVGNLENDDLIRTVLNTIKTDSPEFNFLGKNNLKSLKDTCLNLLDETEYIPKETLIPQMSLVLENDPKLLAAVKESIEQELDEPSTKRVITSIVKTLNNFYKETLAVDVINKIGIDLKFNRSKIGNFQEYMQKALAELEPLTSMVTTVKDPALVGEMDFGNPDSVAEVFDEIKRTNKDDGVYKFGWQALNKATQGGLRNETVIISALQHKYKTGFSLSIFMQLAIHNSPIMTPKRAGKKPLLLRISFEDDLTNNLQFMYQYLKASEGKPVSKEDLGSLNRDETVAYVLNKLTATGFHIKMMRVDPSKWSYVNIFNTIIGLEAQGYAVHVLMLDYLGMLPTTGCTQGPAGVDKRDLLRRSRMFTSARDIAFITPWQMSTEAKQMLRNGVPEHQLVNEVAEKGYYADTKQLDQEADLELHIHIFNHKRKKYLSVRRGKHRIPTVIDDEDKFFMLPFPGLNIPVMPDLDKEDTSFTKLPKGDFDGGSGNSLEDMLA